MIPLALDEVAELCPGRLERASGAEQISGVKIDSRRIERGDLFVAVGDGAGFARDALASGAAAALVPDDAHAALAAVGSAVRARSTARVVAITGSTGKTSTKDILAAICAPRARTVAAEASYNNELGLPLTLCRLEPDTEVCIVELAMRGFGQIAELAAIARPDVGAVTNVGPAHLGRVGGIDGVIRAKTELLDALPACAPAIVPEDFPIGRGDLDVVRFGRPDARIADGRTVVRFDGREVVFSFTARHQARNALVALYIAQALGLTVEGPVDVEFSRWRGEQIPLPGGGLLINDSWNANPMSVRAALEHLVEQAAGRRTVAILGDMAELGPDSPRYHRDAGKCASELRVDALLAIGELAGGYVDGANGLPVMRRVNTVDEALDLLPELLEPGDCVLVKASRAVGLEAVAEAIESGRRKPGA